MSATGYQIARDYESGQLCGWLGKDDPAFVRQQFDLLKSGFRLFGIDNQTRPTTGRKMFLHDVVRKLFGKDTDNYPQQVGDCVSFGAKNAVEYLQCCEKLLLNDREKWRPVFPPYYYGTGRIYVGGGRINGDGSLGSWMAEAVIKYGTLFSDEQGVPSYSGSVAREWGGSQRPLDKWKPTAIAFPVKSAAQINSWDELVAAICNGYPCPTASDVGYSMEPGRDGFHAQTTSWAHQMAFIGVDETHSEPYALILNNWGDAHGRLKDFQTGDDLPVGVLRVRRRDAEKHIRAAETYAYSNFQGFPEQDLDKALFKII